MNFGKFGETETLLLNARSIIACFTAVESSVLSPGFRLFFACSEAVAMLPALVPEMTYEGMAVADGTDAGVHGRRWCVEAWISPNAKTPKRRRWLIHAFPERFTTRFLCVRLFFPLIGSVRNLWVFVVLMAEHHHGDQASAVVVVID